MALSPAHDKIARFGVFELDLRAGELRKNGRKLRLQEQPLQLLAILIDSPGAVVTREELRQKLWPSDMFVDFDHSLNTAVNKVREALGDSASSPRYVETIARRGYRFIAPVQTEVPMAGIAATPSESASAAPSSRPDTIPGANNVSAAGRDGENVAVAALMHPELEIPIPRRSLTRGLFALIQVMYLSFYLAALFRLHIIQNIADDFLAVKSAVFLVVLVMLTAGVGIPLRCYLLSAVGFDYQRLGSKFHRMFPFILALDELWAVAPFLLMRNIGLGAAFAVSAALLYLPFSERTLIRMAYIDGKA